MGLSMAHAVGWVLCAIWALWLPIALYGLQGTSPAFGLVSLAALPLFLWRRPLPTDRAALALLAFLAWCLVTTFWSAGSDEGIITVDTETWNLAIEAPALRLGLIGVLGLIGFWAVHQIPASLLRRIALVACISMGILVVLPVGVTLFYEQVYAIGVAISTEQDLQQNMLRTLNGAVLVLVLAIALLPRVNDPIRTGAFVICAVFLFLLAFKLDGQAALLALLVISVTCLVASKLRAWTFRLLGVATVALILFMPLVIGGLVAASADLTQDDLPLSFYSRLESYDYVVSKISENWLLGWGVEASKGWKDTIEIVAANGVTVDYKVVPGHPHNMALHVWAETGLIGALLLSVFAIALGERLYRTTHKSLRVILPGVAMWSGALVFAALSYSLWKDAFWLTIVWASTAIFALSKTLEPQHG